GDGLGDVGAGGEVELHHGHALDGLRLDVVQAVDVDRVAFDVGGDLALHVGGVEAAVGLGDVDHRQVEGGEDVHRHAHQGQDAADQQGGDAGQHGDRVTQGEDDGIEARLPGYPPLTRPAWRRGGPG